jgi:hypothetical protein
VTQCFRRCFLCNASVLQLPLFSKGKLVGAKDLFISCGSLPVGTASSAWKCPCLTGLEEQQRSRLGGSSLVLPGFPGIDTPSSFFSVGRLVNAQRLYAEEVLELPSIPSSH